MLDPDFMSALGHPARLQALVLLEQRAASTREIAAEVGLSPTATNFHIRKLEQAGLIEQVDARRRRGFEEAVWRTRSKGWARVAKLLAQAADSASGAA
jgi:DNA-binding transcriptional ArsR family regulator